MKIPLVCILLVAASERGQAQLTSVLKEVASKYCPEGWQFDYALVDGRGSTYFCWKLNTEEQNFLDASTRCAKEVTDLSGSFFTQSLDGHLPESREKWQNEKIQEILKKAGAKSVYLAATQQKCFGLGWFYSNIPLYLTFTAWMDIPTKFGESEGPGCSVINTDTGSWDRKECTGKLPSLCLVKLAEFTSDKFSLASLSSGLVRKRRGDGNGGLIWP